LSIRNALKKGISVPKKTEGRKEGKQEGWKMEKRMVKVGRQM
jgi:hypothetical protein